MRGINSESIPLLVVRDVETIRKEARYVFDICLPRVDVRSNPAGRLGVIAIVGPGEFLSRRYEEAVLCEVGLGKSRPYHPAKKSIGSLRAGEYREIPQRRKWFALSEEQYLAVAPVIFSLLQRLTNEKVMAWKHGFFSDDPFLVPTSRNYFSKHQKILFTSSSIQPQPIGVRFAVAKKDEFLLRDIFWVELNSSESIRRLKGLAQFIDLYLSPYKKGFSRFSFLELKRVSRVKKYCIDPLRIRSPHLLPELVELIRGREKNPLWSRLAELLGCGKTAERKLAESALPDSESRTANISLRVITGLSGRNGGSRDHIVFEVLPTPDDS